MPVFGKQFFKSPNETAEAAYAAGVIAVSRGDYFTACHLFNQAAEAGHASAYYNLFLLQGGGYISPLDPDAAADCFYKAAASEHPTAMAHSYLLKAADRAGFGMDNLAIMAASSQETEHLPPLLLVCGCRYLDAVSKKFGAVTDVIAYELDAASNSEKSYVREFIARTGIDTNVYLGGMNRLIDGSAADEITDGLNQLSIALGRSMLTDDQAMMVRCTMLGYLIGKSHLCDRSSHLLGVSDFFQRAC